jgi:hypothetical protein
LVIKPWAGIIVAALLRLPYFLIKKTYDMKLRIFFAVAAFSLLAACETPYRATDTSVVVAPASVNSAFVTQYPNARTVVWSNYDPAMTTPIDWDLAGWTPLTSSDYMVTFNMDGNDYYAWYDANGNWVGSTYGVRDYSSLPTNVQNTINNQYSGYTISAVNQEFMKDRMTYEIELKNSTTKVKMNVDANGNIIKSKSKSL